MWLPFLGFTPFYFMANFGPNAMTNLLAGEVFPTEVRGIGAGLAASFAKARGALAAYLFRIETAGVNLEDVGNVATSGIAGSESPPLPGTPFVDGGRITSPSAPGAARWS